QSSDAVREIRVVDNVEQATTAVLAAAALRTRSTTLLVHVAENSVVFITGSRHSNFSVIEIAAATTLEAHCLAVPLPGGCDLDRPGIIKGVVPTGDFRRCSGCGDAGVGPPGRSSERDTAEDGRDHLPRGHMKSRRLGYELDSI